MWVVTTSRNELEFLRENKEDRERDGMDQLLREKQDRKTEKEMEGSTVEGKTRQEDREKDKWINCWGTWWKRISWGKYSGQKEMEAEAEGCF